LHAVSEKFEDRVRVATCPLGKRLLNHLLVFCCSRASRSPLTIEELLADPSLTRGLVLKSVLELLSQVALRVASLKTLEGALLSLMLSERIATKGPSHAASKLLGARELAELFGVPESWVREQARLGNLPSFKLGHYIRFRIEEVERFLTQRASQAA
jgi:excisionase family DNA binding protein